MTFEDLHLNKNILRAIEELGYQAPTPIQEKVIPLVLAEKDLIGCAQTGTGKTAAFAMPIIHYLHKIGNTKKAKKAKVLIITPTRELAGQIADNFTAYAKYTNVTHITIYGGMSIKPQIEQLKKGADVIIGTPGRLLDLYKQKQLDLDSLHYLVIDEADLMLDMGFIDDVKKLIQLTPSNRQTLLFSATMPLPVRELAHEFLQKPEYVAVDAISSSAKTVKQHVYFVEKSDKKKLLYHIIRNQKLTDVLVFTRTKTGADSVVESLKKNGINAESFHGDKSQTARQEALDSFKNKETKVLVATDIAARGIDIDNLPCVINFDLPNIPETFVHRIGRTGRAGNEGIAISFCDKSEKTYWDTIVKFTRTQPKVVSEHPYPWKEDVKTGQKKTGETSDQPKKDYRNKNKSRKSEASKKKKKRWY
ncbi:MULTISPECIES: DEAD/DEAH box helicase [Myroides]|uniref:DEAD-box ATP-dependent RNA helicase RhpA n=1 Tax=Myroides albus TaxID=2562892 RepID=A0A6I3LQK5_9FLAO|nr:MULTISPECIES: DEAD/DEAH box helicase [Myroides]MTG98951.1 DEAD/DEAH box helicase [Myroides albus]MVX34359.1 DEAD/DEAH box helicase [Myroides sp. LoEW2-1]UVD78581.1 DEAD/DEAH box helicase [Myroides albus]